MVTFTATINYVHDNGDGTALYGYTGGSINGETVSGRFVGQSGQLTNGQAVTFSVSG